MSRYGSCETSRIDNSEGVERHLEAPISLTGIGKKEEPKTNNRLCHVFVLGSYWRRWRDIEPPRSARGKPPGGFSPIGLSCGLQRLQAAHIFRNKKDTDERCLFYWRRWGDAIHVHNTLYSLRWQYYITESLICQLFFIQIFAIAFIFRKSSLAVYRSFPAQTICRNKDHTSF
jgi:hypothetical protein